MIQILLRLCTIEEQRKVAGSNLNVGKDFFLPSLRLSLQHFIRFRVSDVKLIEILNYIREMYCVLMQ